MMANYREILRMKSSGINKMGIASAAQCACNTVPAILERMKARSLEWPLPEGIKTRNWQRNCFPARQENIIYNAGLRTCASGHAAARYIHAAVFGVLRQVQTQKRSAVSVHTIQQVLQGLPQPD